jgi:hypothetical protein
MSDEKQQVVAERRHSTRIPVDFPVVLTVGQKQHKFQAREFSEAGVLLDASQNELVGKEVEVEMTLAPKYAISMKGVVAYAAGIGVGVRFKNVSVEQRSVLKSYILAHC